jgi:hypothetical protein
VSIHEIADAHVRMPRDTKDDDCRCVVESDLRIVLFAHIKELSGRSHKTKSMMSVVGSDTTSGSLELIQMLKCNLLPTAQKVSPCMIYGLSAK